MKKKRKIKGFKKFIVIVRNIFVIVFLVVIVTLITLYAYMIKYKNPQSEVLKESGIVEKTVKI